MLSWMWLWMPPLLFGTTLCTISVHRRSTVSFQAPSDSNLSPPCRTAFRSSCCLWRIHQMMSSRTSMSWGTSICKETSCRAKIACTYAKEAPCDLIGVLMPELVSWLWPSCRTDLVASKCESGIYPPNLKRSWPWINLHVKMATASFEIVDQDPTTETSLWSGQMNRCTCQVASSKDGRRAKSERHWTTTTTLEYWPLTLKSFVAWFLDDVLAKMLPNMRQHFITWIGHTRVGKSLGSKTILFAQSKYEIEEANHIDLVPSSIVTAKHLDFFKAEPITKFNPGVFDNGLVQKMDASFLKVFLNPTVSWLHIPVKLQTSRSSELAFAYIESTHLMSYVLGFMCASLFYHLFCGFPGHTPDGMKWKPAAFGAISGPIWSMPQERLDPPLWLGRLELRSGPIGMGSRTHGSLPPLCWETCVARSTSKTSRTGGKKEGSALRCCQHDLLPNMTDATQLLQVCFSSFCIFRNLMSLPLQRHICIHWKHCLIWPSPLNEHLNAASKALPQPQQPPICMCIYI